MQELNHPSNPFPGLRPFEATETHLFFGRDGQSEELLRRLRRTRFLAVVGTSGSGKSSLVRAGLLPALKGGLMTGAGSDWRIAITRPGNDPIGNLARALASPAVLGSRDEKRAGMQDILTETTLRRSSLGLAELVGRARARLDVSGRPLFHDYENLLVVVDQFEEIFRFKQLIEEEKSNEDAAAFVKLLLEAVHEPEGKVYVVLTMRSDFLGDCAQFRELPEAINDGQYLIPRMTRDERREAITGPVAVGEGAISDPLVNLLLNDVGDNPDQLPILQHALMRTWDYWLGHRRNGEPIDIPDYEAIGGMSKALSRHADEAFGELDDAQQAIAEKMFKGLTERGADNREVRRPMEVGEICKLTGADEAAVVAVVEVFRRQGRSFLMPPPADALTGAPISLTRESLIDISHESLIRNWERLKSWVEEESRSARIYRRLAETAVLHREGGAGLWRDPDLQIALVWREQGRPNEVWARRYHPEFASAMSFLDESVAARDAEVAAGEMRRKREIKRTRLTALIFGVAFLFSLVMGVYAFSAKSEAQASLREAQDQRDRAERAVQIANRQSVIAAQARAQADMDKVKAEEAGQLAAHRAEEAEKQRKLAGEQTLLAEKNAKTAQGEKLKAEGAAKDAAAKKEEALKFAKEGIEQAAATRELLYSSNVGVAQKAIEDNDGARAQKLLRDVVYLTGEGDVVEVAGERLSRETEDLRGFEWYYLWRLASRKLAFFKLNEGAPARPAATPASDRSMSENDYAADYYANRPVTPVFMIPHGLIAASSGDNVVRIWSTQAEEQSGKFTLKGEPSRAIALLNDVTLAAASRKKVIIWNVSDDAAPSEVRPIELGGGLVALDALFGIEDKSGLLAIGSGAKFMLWNVGAPDKVTTLADGGVGGFPSVSFVETAERNNALITCDGLKLTRWDLDTLRPTEVGLLGEDGGKPSSLHLPIISMAFTPDGRTMVTTSFRSFAVWGAVNAEATAYKLKKELPSHRENGLVHTRFRDLVVAISPDGSLLATGDGTDLKNDGGVKLWDITGEEPKELFNLGPDVVYATSLAFSPEDDTLAVGGRDGVQMWDVGEKEPFKSLGKSQVLTLKREDLLKTADRVHMYTMTAVSPDGKVRATSISVGEVKWSDAGQPPPHVSTINIVLTYAMVFSPDGTMLAVGGGGDEADNGEVSLWDVAKREQMGAKIDGHKGVNVAVMSIALSPKGDILATGGDDKTVELWNIRESKLLATLEGHKAPVTSVAYSRDGKTIASGDESGVVHLWSASSYQLLMTLKDKAATSPIRAIAFSEENDILYTRDEQGEVRFWPTAGRDAVDYLLQSSSFGRARPGFVGGRAAFAPGAQTASTLSDIEGALYKPGRHL